MKDYYHKDFIIWLGKNCVCMPDDNWILEGNPYSVDILKEQPNKNLGKLEDAYKYWSELIRQE